MLVYYEVSNFMKYTLGLEDLQSNLKSRADRLFSQVFDKLLHVMSQTSRSPKLFFFFAKFIPSDILTMPEILFCLVEIIFLLLYRNY